MAAAIGGLLTISLVSLGMTGACSRAKGGPAAPSTTVSSAAAPVTDPPISNPPELDPVTVSMAFTGDVLPHRPLLKVIRQADGTYSYVDNMHGLKEYISTATIGVHHQEVPDGPDDKHISGYPTFAAPPSLMNSVKELGYDAITTASNHTIDQGLEGALRTIKHARERELGVAGTNSNAEEDPIQYYQVTSGNHAVKIAHLSNTYGLNQGSNPKVIAENPWLMTIDDPDYLIRLAQQARKNGAQVVVLSTHDGIEYQTEPSAHQREAAQKYAQSGVIDFVISHHAHVPEPIEKLAGGVNGNGMWIYWGLGNLLSSQAHNKPYTQLGIIALVTFSVDKDDQVNSVQAGWQGVMLDRSRHQVYTFDRLEAGRPENISLSEGTIKSYRDALFKVVGDQAVHLAQPPAASEGVQLEIVPRGIRSDYAGGKD